MACRYQPTFTLSMLYPAILNAKIQAKLNEVTRRAST
jgi:hypothetical protein